MNQTVLSKAGLLFVDKPVGPTTYDLIRWIKRSIKKTKIGHCGTLDPNASGLVIILLGKATKKQHEYMGQDKTYLFKIKLGVQTDSGDITGQAIQEKPVPQIDSERIESTLKEFLGKQSQIPPMYSALKHKGQPLYKLARKGQEVKREPREIVIHKLDFLTWDQNSELELRAHVSSGTYVRTLAEDIGKSMGTVGTLISLRRESIGSFNLEAAIEGDKLKEMNEQQIWENAQGISL